MSAFCAICTADIVGEPLRRPLGRNDAMVNVCAKCDEQPVIARAHHRGYDQTPSLSFSDLQRGIERLASSLKRTR